MCCCSMRIWVLRGWTKARRTSATNIPVMAEAAKPLPHDNPGVAVIYLCGEPTFALDGDVADTTAIAVLPSSCPAALLDSSVRLAAQRTRELRSAREEVALVRQQLENRKAIERAKGILMRRTGLSEQ